MENIHHTLGEDLNSFQNYFRNLMITDAVARTVIKVEEEKIIIQVAQ